MDLIVKQIFLDYGYGREPHLVITEQPIDKFRFRYKSEMAGTHGCLNGRNSDKTRLITFPTVEVFKNSSLCY